MVRRLRPGQPSRPLRVRRVWSTIGVGNAIQLEALRGRRLLLLTGALLMATGCAGPSQTAPPPTAERLYPGALPFSPDEMRAALILPPETVEEQVPGDLQPGDTVTA